MRIYYEMTNGGAPATAPRAPWTSVPLGVAYFPGELTRFPKMYVFCPAGLGVLCRDVR